MSVSTLVRLLFAGFLFFLCNTVLFPGVAIDLMAVYTLVGALGWRYRGAFLTASWSGILVSSVSDNGLFTVIFYYALIGYMAALLLERSHRRGWGEQVGLSLALAALISVSSIALLSSGTPVVEIGQALINHAIVIFALLLCSSRMPLHRNSLEMSIVR